MVAIFPVSGSQPGAAPARVRSTINLKSLANPPEPSATPAPAPAVSKPVTAPDVQRVWQAYAEQHRDRTAEHQLLSREIALQESTIHLALSHPLEEQLFESLRTALTAFLRQQLQNSSISIQTRLEAAPATRKPYTNREKFEHLAAKNPVLRELEQRLGLDADV